MIVNYTLNLNEKNTSRLLISLVVIYLFLYVMREVIGVPIPDSIFSLYCMCAFLALDENRAFSFYLATIITTIPFFEVRIGYIFITIIKHVAKSRGKIYMDNMALITITLMLFIQFIDLAIFSKDSFFEFIYKFIQVATILIIPLLWTTINLKKSDIVNAIYCFVSGILICALSLLWQSIERYGWAVVVGGQNRLGMDLDMDGANMSTSLNTNVLAILMVCVVVLSFVLGYCKKMPRGFIAFNFVLAFIVILTTLSRGGILKLGIFLVFYVLFCIKGKFAFTKRITLVALITVVVMYAFIKLPDIGSGLMYRLTNVSDITNGRIELNEECLSAWMDNLYSIFFGYGAQNYLTAVSTLKNSAHNMVVDVLVSWGLVGLMTIVGWYYYLYKAYIKRTNAEPLRIALLPAVMYIISLQDGQFLTVETPFMILSFFFIIGNLFSSVEMSRIR